MKRAAIYGLALGAGLLLSRPASAQLLLAPAPADRTLVDIGFEPETVISAAYLHAFGPPGVGRTLALGAGLKLAPVALGHVPVRFDLIAAGHRIFRERWGATLAAHLYLVHDHNDAGRFWGPGLELRAQPGYQRGAWSAGLDLGWQSNLLTHVRHSALATSTFDDRYPDAPGAYARPVDGWYLVTSSRFRLGVAAAHAFSRRISGAVALGTLFSLQHQGVFYGFALGQVPVYLELAGQLAF